MQEDLRRGYEVLLGRSLDTFETDARYEVWFYVDAELLPEHEHVPELTMQQLVVGRPPAPAATHDTNGRDFWQRYAVDHARSLFVFDKHDLADAPDALVVALQANRYALTGEELVRAAERIEGEPDEVFDAVLELCWYTCRRAVTSGALVDAMAAATLSASAPNALLARESYALGDDIRFEPRWEHALRDIEDEVVREHLLMSCVDLQTSRWAGSWIDPKRQADAWLAPVVKRGGEILAIWHCGDHEASRAVVKFAAGAVPQVAMLAADESRAIPIVRGEATPRRKRRRKQ